LHTQKKLYLSHSGKWMQVDFSLSHSNTFTCTTPVKPYKFHDFPGVVQLARINREKLKRNKGWAD
jgi:hypothetical protein